ncbi:MAG: hypothetical protein LBP93_00325 [Treponema sp.]|jgi:hypothetical protein|nr:hypothetical protein [Treponema sp.]
MGSLSPAMAQTLTDPPQALPEMLDTLDAAPADSSAPGENAAEDAGPGGAALPRSFRNIRLGLGLDDLKTTLQNDGAFHFRGDRDVSFLPSREQSLVETTGFSFIRRAFFQLREGELFIMAFSLDPELIDHYSVFTTFVKKYGEPVFLDPKQAVWESSETRIAIERPLTVKYIDKRVFNQIIEESTAEEAGEVFLRQEFLDSF